MGDYAGHPFRGNQYTRNAPTARAVRSGNRTTIVLKVRGGALSQRPPSRYVSRMVSDGVTYPGTPAGSRRVRYLSRTHVATLGTPLQPAGRAHSAVAWRRAASANRLPKSGYIAMHSTRRGKLGVPTAAPGR